MKIACYDCNTETELRVGFEVVNFVCPNCQSLYTRDSEGMFRRRSKYKTTLNDFPLAIGDIGFLKGSEYKVTGILVKKVHPDYRWTEFILENHENECIYLSVSNGHWILLTEMEEVFEVKKHPLILEHNNKDYNIFEYSDAAIINAQGFFDFELPQNKNIHLVEYIRPPYMISVERMNGVETAFYGEYIKKEEIKKAFKNVVLPYKFGVNMIQPSRFNLNNTAIIFCCIAALLIATNWFIYKDQFKQKVFSKSIKFAEFDNKEITSDAFILNGGSAPLSITVATDVDNSWANLNVALVNEMTNDEIYANKDIEFYHGYSDGESWTEGDNMEKFNICGVKAGRYHLLITPMKAPEDVNNSEMRVNVVWNEPSNRNVWMVVIAMIVIYLIIWFFTYNFEKERWADSSYSRYDE
ncbi:DUF4178 domain-containing protein [Flavobacterium tructae]|uniref:DUF4178 domain-containing protein n=1 Tax=Flavobacterium tructae TaxID=1114873 RepID=A0A1S1J6L1_9FLAO|nr:DUF4178 domain-containing protein [Flavobacterium tructae]OHT46292.1 hypothetical protein BHE19_01935 [Flavobacterium tructae]OXB22254.1 hypothetical protein B0A71_01980 [Flavobacterium tructae]